jgi:phage shock protein A
MGILDRLSTLIKSNLNSAVDKMSDPGREIDQLIMEMEENSRKARAEVQATLTLEKRERMRVEALQKSAREWEDRASRAVQAGDDALAKEALERKLEVDAEITEANAGLEEQRKHVDQLTLALKALDQRVKEVRLRKETLKSQARAQRSRERGTDKEAFERYEQIVTNVDVQEAELALDDELAASRHEDSKSLEVERKLRDLEKDSKGSEIDDRLAALKAKLDKKET